MTVFAIVGTGAADDAARPARARQTVGHPVPRGRQVGDDEVGRGLKARLAHRATGAAVPEVCILAVGKLLAAAEAAASALEAEGVRCTVWDVRVVTPLDSEMIADAARHPVVVTVEDGIREGGAGSRIVDELARTCTGPDIPRVEVLGTPIAFIPHGKPDRILSDLGLDGPGIAATVRSILPLDLRGRARARARPRGRGRRGHAPSLPRRRPRDPPQGRRVARHRRRHRGGSGDAHTARAASTRSRGARRGGGPDRRPGVELEVDPRSDRRHSVVRARAADLGDAHRARARGRHRRGGRISSRARPAVVGGAWLGASSDHGSLRVSSVDRPRAALRARQHQLVAGAREGPQFGASRIGCGAAGSATSGCTCWLLRAYRRRAEPTVSLWDLAAVQVIVEEAGGRFTDLSGVARADGGSALSTNGLLHDAALAALR